VAVGSCGCWTPSPGGCVSWRADR